MSRRVTLIPGDGIGSEVVKAACDVVDAMKLGISWEFKEAGLATFEKTGSALPDDTIESIKKNKIALKGPTTTPVGKGHKSSNVLLRQALDLYASIRPIKSLPGIKSRYTDVDLVVVRENTEGLYKGIEHKIAEGTVVSLKVVTEKASLRIARKAFALAKECEKKSVTVAHKANILKLGDGLFLDCAHQAAKDFPEVEAKDAIIDALCMRLVSDPTQFDILLMENLYGDIVSDLCAGLIGGLGLVPGANIGDDAAVFEAVHGSAPDIAGKGVANPIAMILSSSMMLQHMGEASAAKALNAAIYKAMTKGDVKTPDLGGSSTTDDMARAVIAQL